MISPIPLSSPDITEAERDAVAAVLRTPTLSLGPELAAFESAFAAYHSVPHAIAVSSGTAGLHMALLTLGIGEGDEVIVPSFAFVAVANAVLSVRATPVFADIDPITFNLTAATVACVLTPRTRAILVVHTFGVPAEMATLRALATRHGLVLIEDACEAIGATIKNRRVGSFGDLAVFGFYPNKQLTTGEGGAILAHTQAHADRLRSLRNQGRAARLDPFGAAGPQNSAGWLDHAEIGYNYRLSEIACALGRVQLSRIAEILTLRRAVAERYEELLSGIPCIFLPPLTIPDGAISWFVYVIRVSEETSRDQVQASLAERGIATGRYFAPIHLQPAWQNHPSAAIRLPLTESIAPLTLALPFFNRIRAEQQKQVASALRDAITSQHRRDR